MDIAVEVTGFGVFPDGTVQTVNDAQDNGPYSARSFISISSNSFHLEPGDTRDFVATISVPSNVGNGGRYAIIYVRQQQPTGRGSTSSISAFNIPILITITNSQLVHTGKIRAVTHSEAVSGKPIDIYTTFQNTGNHHFKIRGEVIVTDTGGKTLDTIYTAVTPSSIIPTMSFQVKATFISQVELPLGLYSIMSKVMLEDGTVLDEANGSFEVKAPYVPPPPPASVTLEPSLAAILSTDDGRISINFPQGSVTSQAKISVQNYPLEQLPAPPLDCQLATTCFRIDGLNGLLTKPVTISVKYSPADLEKAGGDASKLTLARWDEATGKWSLLKTAVDTENTTLTADTNQFSIWAIMVGPPKPPVNWLLVVIASAGGILVLAGLLLVIAKRKRS